MVVVESSMAGGRKEVALAAMMLLGGVLQAHAGPAAAGSAAEAESGSVLSEAMWKRAMRAVDVGVEAATTPGCQVPLQASGSVVRGCFSKWAGLRAWGWEMRLLCTHRFCCCIAIATLSCAQLV